MKKQTASPSGKNDIAASHVAQTTLFYFCNITRPHGGQHALAVHAQAQAPAVTQTLREQGRTLCTLNLRPGIHVAVESGTLSYKIAVRKGRRDFPTTQCYGLKDPFVAERGLLVRLLALIRTFRLLCLARTLIFAHMVGSTAAPASIPVSNAEVGIWVVYYTVRSWFQQS